jgi:hypothetical protein
VTLRKWSRSVSRVNRSPTTLVTCSVDSADRPRWLRTALELGAYYPLFTVDDTFVDGYEPERME